MSDEREKPAEIDTTNDYLVGVLGDDIVIMKRTGRMTKAEALRMAAYLVALGDDENIFPAVLAAVQNA